MRADTADYRALFLADTPLMDARAPIEFARGAFPHAVNLPLMSDKERHEVGLCYTQQGPEAAIALGHRLVGGEVKAERLAAWATFAKAHPDGYLYCFRGGMRSQIVQTWLREDAGIAYPRITGGYKAMRGFLLETIAKAAHPTAMVVLGGMTGTGKTDVLTRLANGIDLEGHAHHRGSSFGKRVRAQPAQIDFENALAIDILRRQHTGHRMLVFEDEGQTVGGRSMPFDLYQAMQKCPLVWLEDTQAHRIERILRDYVVDLRAEFIAAYGVAEGDARFAERLRQSLDKIAKRLGGERHNRLRATLNEALAVQRDTGAVDAHRAWIARLLVEYYDPMYAYQRQLKRDRIVMTGDAEAVGAFLRRLGA